MMTAEINKTPSPLAGEGWGEGAQTTTGIDPKGYPAGSESPPCFHPNLSCTHYRNLLRVENERVHIILCAGKDPSVVRYSVLHDNEQLFASKYKTVLPSEDELKAELEKEQRWLAERKEVRVCEGINFCHFDERSEEKSSLKIKELKISRYARNDNTDIFLQALMGKDVL